MTRCKQHCRRWFVYKPVGLGTLNQWTVLSWTSASWWFLLVPGGIGAPCSCCVHRSPNCKGRETISGALLSCVLHRHSKTRCYIATADYHFFLNVHFSWLTSYQGGLLKNTGQLLYGKIQTCNVPSPGDQPGDPPIVVRAEPQRPRGQKTSRGETSTHQPLLTLTDRMWLLKPSSTMLGTSVSRSIFLPSRHSRPNREMEGTESV